MSYTHHFSSAYFVFGFLFLLFFGFTTTTHAYFTTNQEELNVGNGVGLFLIEYSFGHAKHDIFLPIVAEQDEEQRNTTVSYDILDEQGNAVTGKTSAIVLSDSAITDTGMYKTPKGAAKKFTLAVFFTPETRNSASYRLQVTHLPFNFDGVQQLELNPSELRHYTTSPLHL